MKLIYLVQYFPPEKASGLQLVKDLLEGFVKHGWQVNVYTPTPTRGITKEKRKEYAKKRREDMFDGNLTIYRMPLYKEGKNIFLRAFRYLIFSIECFWKVVTIPADFIFTGSGPPTQGIIVGIAKKISHKKVIYNVQDIFPDSLVTSGICPADSFLMKIGRKIERFTYRNADIIITITNSMKMNIVEKGVNPEKVTVVQNWIDINQIKPVERKKNSLFEEFKIPRHKFIILYAGNLGKVQGLEVLLDAAEILKGKDNIQFIIFGNGSEEKTIIELLNKKKLTNLVIFPLQPMERISEVYSIGNVCLLSCRPGTGGSGMPSKTWAMMAAGRAILGSFDLNSEMNQILKAADCGYCVEPGSARALAKAVMDLSEHPEIVSKMGANARKYAEEQAVKEKAVQRYIDIIENVVGERIQ